jgi:hypothetical protein
MQTSKFLILLVSLSLSCLSSLSNPLDSTPIVGGESSVSTSWKIFYEVIFPKCVNSVTSDHNLYPSGQSIENFIALIEKLENRIYDTSDSSLAKLRGAEQTAKVILRRYLRHYFK